MQKTIDDEIKNKTYDEETNNTLKDIKNPDEFLHRNFKY